MDCPHCGESIPSFLNKCTRCGGSIDEEFDSGAHSELTSQRDASEPKATEKTEADTAEGDHVDVSKNRAEDESSEGDSGTAHLNLGALREISGFEDVEIGDGDEFDGDVPANDSETPARSEIGPEGESDNGLASGLNIVRVDETPDEDGAGFFEEDTRHGEGADVVEEPSGKGSLEEGRLLLFRADGTVSHRLELESEVVVVGRNSEVVPFRQDPSLSMAHAKVIRRADGVFIRDLNSANGTFQEVAEPTPLAQATRIRIGKQVFQFELLHNRPGSPIAVDDFISSPNPGYWGRLAKLVAPDTFGDAFALSNERVILGRDGCDIELPDDEYISSNHASIEYRDHEPTITDLDSSNGTFVSISGDHKLSPGDRLLIGRQLMAFDRDRLRSV